MRKHVKRRGRPAPGSIPEALDMFRAEVRFYREIAPVAGVRVPACYQAEDTAEGPERVVQAELAAGQAGPVTLVHGDASADNMRTGPDGEIALLDWEDVSALPGVTDLAWFLVSSVPPAQWEDAVAAYGEAGAPDAPDALDLVLPSASVRGLLSLADTEPGSADAMALAARLEQAGRRLDA